MQAAEKLTLTEITPRLAEVRNYARRVSQRIENVSRPNAGRQLLEVGAGVGAMTIALSETGYICTGLEPDEQALETARELARVMNRSCPILKGHAEELPFADHSFDIVFSNSVVEHVADVGRCFSEVYRVLRPGGLFWFETASAMSPFQHEIRNFPLFGWYPDRLKKKIMGWAAEKHPELVGYTTTPAVNWFSDKTARRGLLAAGFTDVIDRWHLRRESEGGQLHAYALKLIRSHALFTRIANAAIPDCAYAAIKSL